MVATEAELESAIRDFRERLERGIRVEAIVLFGSYARGTAHEWSDVDLAVISPDFEGVPINRRQETIADLTHHRAPNLSPIGYPTSEYRDPGRHSFLREIIRTGRVVYNGPRRS
jgi:uncharacterized protein